MPDLDRYAVMTFMLGRGTERLSSPGGWLNGVQEWRKFDVGRRVTVRQFRVKYGDQDWRSVVTGLVANGSATSTGRGRHAGWALTESGVNETIEWNGGKARGN